jgi:hypothetical protein
MLASLCQIASTKAKPDHCDALAFVEAIWQRLASIYSFELVCVL